MVVKKNKIVSKKPVKKTMKKVVKAKKAVSSKKPVKKVVKKALKQNTTKSAGKKTKVNKPSSKKTVTKQVTKKQSSVKKSARPVAQMAAKKAAQKPVAKKAIPEKTASVVAPAMKTVARTKPMGPTVKKPTIEPSKKTMIPRKSHDMMEEMGVVEFVQMPARKKATTLLGALEFTPYEPKPDENYMNDRQRDHFRKILDAWKQQLMQDVDLTVGHLKEDAVFYADPVDRAAQEEGFNLELRTRDRERRLIKKIEQSLDLLNTGEYGFCEDCGAEIGIRRLEARPTAVKCIDCKTFQEIREKQLGG